MRNYTPTLKGLFLAASLLSAPLFMHAQYFWETGMHLGGSNYLGDIGGNELTRRDFWRI